jgi:phosphatidylserine/phosphatidylglycerophosphate/cardiolipin synthase-like enzyme
MALSVRSWAIAALIVLSFASAATARHHHHREKPTPSAPPMTGLQDDSGGGAQIIEPGRGTVSEGSREVTAGTGDFFVEPEAGIKPVVGAMEQARKSLNLVVYLLSDDRIVSALKRAKDRGVTVRVMVEPHPYGGGGGNGKTFDKLQRLGIPVRYTPHRFRYTHEKAFIVDHRVALISTGNFTRSAFSKNREYGFFDRDPGDVKEIEALFDADWADRPATPHQARLVVSPTNSRAKIVTLIRSARQSLFVQDETCSDPEVIGAIADRQRAGVQVTVEVAEARDLDKLQAAGIPAKQLQSHYLHAKTIVADDARAYVGSENLTANSLDNNRELGILLTDPAILGQLTGVVRADWDE